ncbi:MAG TPA: DNA internalization-related competence protein ComEC/Rec2 [Candidatus Limnocylindria bacterium]
MPGAHRLLPAALAGVAAGILVADAGFGPPALAPAAVGAALLVLGRLLGPRGSLLALVGAAAVGGSLGTWRHEAAAPLRDGGASVGVLADAAATVEGIVVDDPRPRGDRLQLVLGEVVSSDGARYADRLLVWMTRGLDARSGDRLRVDGDVELAEDFDGFAYREYLARQGVGGIVRARSATVVAAATGAGAILAGVRAWLLDGLNATIPEPEAALGAGILLGVRSSIAPEVGDAFATAGLTHVVAISGWNIAIVVALVLAACRPLESRPGGRWTTVVAATLAVGAYVLLTGASPSVVRAALMAGAMVVGRLAGSRAHATSALGLAALVMLLVAPSVLWDVGFQLSLLATAGLVWFAAPIERRLARWPAWIREPVSLTCAAQLTTLPVILVNFERLSLIAPVGNVLVVPLVPLAMLGSALAAIGGALAATIPIELLRDAVTWLLGGAAWLVLRAMIVVGQACAAVPFAAVDVQVPPPFAVAWFPLLALATWAIRTNTADEPAARVPDEAMTGTMAALARLARPLPAMGVLLAVLGAVTFASLPDGRLHVTALAIGQGDAILVEAPSGSVALIDGGPDPDLTLRRLGANLPYHLRRIDLLVVSHPHQDHVAGLVDVLDRFRVRGVLEAAIPYGNPSYERLLADAGAGHVPVATARTGMRIALDATTSLEVLYPGPTDAAAPLLEGDINNGSIVLVLRHGAFSALLTGDAEAPVEELLLERGLVPRVDLLKVGHHGSHSSTTPSFVAAADPAVAMISAGVDNEYGHPAPETLATLGAAGGILVLRTDIHGDLEVTTDGRRWQARTDEGVSGWRPVRGTGVAASIGRWPSLIARPSSACSPMRGFPTASVCTARAWPAWLARPPGSSPRPASRWTAGSSRRRRCSTTSTSPRSGAPAASTASSARAGSRTRGTRSSRSRSPPTRSPPSSTTSASPSAGPRSSWPSPTATWRRPSSPSTSGSTT